MWFIVRNWMRVCWKWAIRLFPISVPLFILFSLLPMLGGNLACNEAQRMLLVEATLGFGSLVTGIALAAATYTQLKFSVKLILLHILWLIITAMRIEPRQKLLQVIEKCDDKSFRLVNIISFVLSSCVLLGIFLLILGWKDTAFPELAFLGSVVCCPLSLFCLVFLREASTKKFHEIYEEKILPFLAIQGAWCSLLTILLFVLGEVNRVHSIGDVINFLLEIFCLSIHFMFVPLMVLPLLYILYLVRRLLRTETPAD